MQTFDNTRPLVAAMAVGLTRACLERAQRLLGEAGDDRRLGRPADAPHAAAPSWSAIEADYEAARLLTLEACWMAATREPNSLEASMAKAKARALLRRRRRSAASRLLRRAAGYGEGCCWRSGPATRRSSTSSRARSRSSSSSSLATCSARPAPICAERRPAAALSLGSGQPLATELANVPEESAVVEERLALERPRAAGQPVVASQVLPAARSAEVLERDRDAGHDLQDRGTSSRTLYAHFVVDAS